MIAYGLPPTGLAAVAAVARVGRVSRSAGVSPFTSPLYTAVRAGTACPKTFVWSAAVIVRGAGVTVSWPGTKAKV